MHLTGQLAPGPMQSISGTLTTLHPPKSRAVRSEGTVSCGLGPIAKVGKVVFHQDGTWEVSQLRWSGIEVGILSDGQGQCHTLHRLSACWAYACEGRAVSAPLFFVLVSHIKYLDYEFWKAE